MSYLCQSSGTAISLLFNRFGERLVKVTFSYNPDVWELPKPRRNLLTEDLARNDAEGSGQNLTDATTGCNGDSKQYDYAVLLRSDLLARHTSLAGFYRSLVETAN
jgi:hypothetical protein